MIQVRLQSTFNPPRELVTWVPEGKKFGVGDYITLKNYEDPDLLWEVLEIYGKNTATIHKDWKVGGLQ